VGLEMKKGLGSILSGADKYSEREEWETCIPLS